jgi:hypothetical protein
LARPYICRLIILMRLTWPSTGPVVAQRESIGDRVVVAANTHRERAQLGSVVGLHRGQPVVEPVAAQAGDHDREPADVLGEPIQLWAGLADSVWVQILDRPRDLALNLPS